MPHPDIDTEPIDPPIPIDAEIVAMEGGARTLSMPHRPRHAVIGARRYGRKVARRLRVDPLDDWPEGSLVTQAAARRWQRRAFWRGAIATAAGALAGLWLGNALVVVGFAHALGVAAVLIGGVN